MNQVLQFARSEFEKYYLAVVKKKAIDIVLEVDQSIVKPEDDAYLDERFIIDIKGGKGYIKGINERSVLIGVYHVFRALGCVFLRPGVNGERLVNVLEKDFNVSISFKPYYRFRTVTIEGSNSIEDILDLIDWSIKNGFNSYFTQFRQSFTFFEHWYNHERNEFAISENLTPERVNGFMERLVGAVKQRGMLYHAVGHGWTCECLGVPSQGWHTIKDEAVLPQQRKYVAQIGGKRKFFLDIPLYSQLCYSNPEVRKMIVDEVISYIQNNNQIDYLHFWLGDNYNNFCECENCVKKMPTDWYFIMLNDLDRRLTELNLNTKIVFLIYLELLWPAKEIELINPERFVMMFAPITRTYSNGLIKDEKSLNREMPLPNFNLNHTTFPSSTEENLAFLFNHQKTFKGDAFDFDYHLMWEPYKDFSGLQIAEIIFKDVKSMQSLGLKGIVSCQIQKVFMPHGFGMFVMGRTLEDPFLCYDDLKKEYFNAVYGSHVEYALNLLTKIQNSSLSAYLRNEIEQVNPKVELEMQDLCNRFVQSANEIESLYKAEEDQTIKLNLFYLKFYCELLNYYCLAVKEKASGQPKEVINTKLKVMHEFLFKNENSIARAMDTYQFDLMAEQILNSEWSVVKREN